MRQFTDLLFALRRTALYPHFLKDGKKNIFGIDTLQACQNMAQTLCFLNTISVWLVPLKRLLLGALNAEYSSCTPGPGHQTCHAV